MRSIILDLAITLDGFIEGPNGETDWCILDDDMDFEGFLDGIDTIFYGRVSYDVWGNYKPAPDASAAERALWNAVHTKEKYVFSKKNHQDHRATFITSNVAEEVARIKETDGRDIWLYGGAGLIKTFVDLNLIDIYRLSVHPIFLGQGKRLIENPAERIQLRHIDTKTFRSGVVQLIYEAV
jgi:dihydrofolate reductase